MITIKITTYIEEKHLINKQQYLNYQKISFLNVITFIYNFYIILMNLMFQYMYIHIYIK